MDGNGLTKVKLPLARFCGVKYTKKTTRGQTAEEKIPNSIINDSLRICYGVVYHMDLLNRTVKKLNIISNIIPKRQI